jgi:hypothetical protein
MRLKVADAVSVELERTYKAVFTPRHGRPALILDSILRHREAIENGRASLGFNSSGLNSEGLRTSTASIGESLQALTRRSDPRG